MRRNRKKADTYRFNGVWGMNSVGIAELETLIQRFRHKLTDPTDPDDKKWTVRWLRRFQREAAKKERGLEKKQRDEAKARKRLHEGLVG
jgi:hypothetical protein